MIQEGEATEGHPHRAGKFPKSTCLVAPTRRRKAKEDEADGVSLLSFAVHPPSPNHQTISDEWVRSMFMISLGSLILTDRPRNPLRVSCVIPAAVVAPGAVHGAPGVLDSQNSIVPAGPLALRPYDPGIAECLQL